MSIEKKIDAEKIQILNIRTVKGNIEAAADADTEAITGHKFGFEAGMGFNIAEKFIGVHLVVNITAIDKEGNELNIQGSYTHEVVFKLEDIENFTEVHKDNDGNDAYQIDGLMGSTILSIAYSTVRGIIYSRTQGTSLGTVILPVIDPKALAGFSQT